MGQVQRNKRVRREIEGTARRKVTSWPRAVRRFAIQMAAFADATRQLALALRRDLGE